MTEQKELLPCPFCGEAARLESRAPGGTGASGMEPYMRRVGCLRCAVWSEWKHPESEWGKQHIHDQALKDGLTAKWNQRAGMAELIEAAKHLTAIGNREPEGEFERRWARLRAALECRRSS